MSYECYLKGGHSTVEISFGSGEDPREEMSRLQSDDRIAAAMAAMEAVSAEGRATIRDMKASIHDGKEPTVMVVIISGAKGWLDEIVNQHWWPRLDLVDRSHGMGGSSARYAYRFGDDQMVAVCIRRHFS